MISDARGGHVSPGVYTEVRDVVYSTKSLGITTLGVAGETLKGPAFQPISIASWTDFTDYFGGTSTIKYKGTNYPKYELPYIAKAYLDESKQLEVVRVLGLSGYWAGKAWIIKAHAEKQGPGLETLYDWVKTEWQLRKNADGTWEDTDEYITYFPPITETGKTETQYRAALADEEQSEMDKEDTGTTIVDGSSISEVTSYQVCSAKTDLKIDVPVVVLRSKKTKDVSAGTTGSCETYSKTWQDLVTKIEVMPYTGKTYGADCKVTSVSGVVNPSAVVEYDSACSISIDQGKFALKVTYKGGTAIYNVSMNPNDPDYIYKVLPEDPLTGSAPIYIEAVYDMALNKSLSDFAYNVSHDCSGNCSGYSGTIEAGYSIVSGATGSEKYFDYISCYRCAVTPWIVSDVKAAGSTGIELKRLFKVYTISDGNAANYQVKISFQRIRPSEGLFDILVRDFYDNDNAPVVLEKFSNCSMVEGEANFIGLKIGTIDGSYPAKSKYISIELNNEEGVDESVPCGFLGYPVPKYGTTDGVSVEYNTLYDSYVKPKRQYFGLNSFVLDYDILNYKGVNAYDEATGDADPAKLTAGFHLDAIIGQEGGLATIDGKSFKFTTVDAVQSVPYSNIPRLVASKEIEEGLYKDINLRKFTVYPYGGFDGWNINDTARTNTDDYRGNKYTIGDTARTFENTEVFRYVDQDFVPGLDPQVSMKLPNVAITSDYYAYLAGYMQFANPEDVDINLFATPGINWSAQTLLTEDALDIIEDGEDGRGGDALYVMASPQYDSDMVTITPEELVDALNETEIDSPYACTYYPWVKYWDGDNRRYIDLPATKDVVRDMAATDNVSFPWFSPAGLTRGEVDCQKAYVKTSLLDEDTLYENMVNPIKTFAVDGVKVWGNKTLYHLETPRNRINVARLMIRVKKLISQAARNLIFEQYDVTLEKQFRSLVEPILQDVKSNRGIYDYRVVTEVTEETRDQHILPAKILIKPTPALEYISISFVVYPEQVSFDDAL